MRTVTQNALRRLNRRFYDHHADRFDRSRRGRPWPGWTELLDRFPRAATRPSRVLDAGCGNGRFGAFLAEHQPPVDYFGLDEEPALLEAAREVLAPHAEAGEIDVRLERADLLEDDFAQALGTRRFDLIVLFGVLHHIPGEVVRGRLLAELGRYLARDGRLVVSFWRFDRSPRFERQLLPWEEADPRSLEGIDVGELEPGDHLLSFGGDLRMPRYCHLADDPEIDRLIAASGLRSVGRYAADGPGGSDNDYVLLEA